MAEALYSNRGSKQNGRERPQKLFGRLEAEKVGPLPPVSDLFPPVLFETEFSMWFSSRLIEHARAKIVVQAEFLTVFTTQPR